MVLHSVSTIDINNPEQTKLIPTEELLSREDAVGMGLSAIKATQEERRGYYESADMRSIELIYVMKEDRLVLAWEIIDVNFAQVAISALDGRVLYWSM